MICVCHYHGIIRQSNYLKFQDVHLEMRLFPPTYPIQQEDSSPAPQFGSHRKDSQKRQDGGTSLTLQFYRILEPVDQKVYSSVFPENRSTCPLSFVFQRSEVQISKWNCFKQGYHPKQVKPLPAWSLNLRPDCLKRSLDIKFKGVEKIMRIFCLQRDDCSVVLPFLPLRKGEPGTTALVTCSILDYVFKSSLQNIWIKCFFTQGFCNPALQPKGPTHMH